jgi:TRAP-type mannitol/chloroaromatic compound transport system substrate-binding protein
MFVRLDENGDVVVTLKGLELRRPPDDLDRAFVPEWAEVEAWLEAGNALQDRFTQDQWEGLPPAARARLQQVRPAG